MKRIIIKKWKSGHWGNKPGYKYLLKCLICKNPFELRGCVFNKGKGFFCSLQCNGVFKKGRPSGKKGKKYPHTGGKNAYNWKGEKVSYSGLHHWIIRQLGKFPKKCEKCGRKGIKNKTRWSIQWANLDHKYIRNIKYWRAWCIFCHRRYDFKHNLKPDNKIGNNQFSTK